MRLVPQLRLLQVALTNIRRLNPKSGALRLVPEISRITGIPSATLLVAGHRMARTGSLRAFRDLLSDPAVPKVGGLRYELVVRQISDARQTATDQLGQELVLAMISTRGRLEMQVAMHLRQRSPAWRSAARQSAQISVTCRLDAGKGVQAFHQEMTINRG